MDLLEKCEGRSRKFSETGSERVWELKRLAIARHRVFAPIISDRHISRSTTDSRKRDRGVYFDFDVSTMAKSKKPKAKGKGKDPGESAAAAPSGSVVRPSSSTAHARITIKDVLQEPPSDDSSASSEMPPESEWDEQALLLKQKIESGGFDHLLDQKSKRRQQSKGAVDGDEDSSSIEEVDLDAEDERSRRSEREESEEEKEDGDDEEVDAADDGSLEASEDDASDEEEHEDGDATGEGQEEDGSSEEEIETGKGNGDDEENESSDEEEESDDNDDRATRLSKKNHISSKALHVVTESLQARKREWPWAETFDVISSDPLPFDRKRVTDDDGAVEHEVVDIHDDLKREVAFYDIALAAVKKAREQCSAAQILFSRPEDFFAEMVKTDGTSNRCGVSCDR
jgi:Eukaryotic rRNA processing protein EBP2